MAPEKFKELKHIEVKKKKVEVSEDDKEILEKYNGKEEHVLTLEERNVIDIINKRKTVEMITREYNLALKPLGKELVSPGRIEEILNSLRERDLVMSVTGGDGKEYWVDKAYYREKLFGTEKL